MGRTIQAILLGGHQDLGAMNTCLMSNALQFQVLVLMMIGEGPAEDDVEAQRLQRIPEILRVTETAEGGDSASRENLIALAGAVIAPLTGEQPRTKDGG